MDKETKQKHIDYINGMPHYQMARMWRHSPAGHIYFDRTLPFFEIFEKRFNEFGGMTSKISKEIGWIKRELD